MRTVDRGNGQPLSGIKKLNSLSEAGFTRHLPIDVRDQYHFGISDARIAEEIKPIRINVVVPRQYGLAENGI